MDHRLLIYALQYAVYALEIGVLACLVWGRNWKKYIGVLSYVSVLFATDAVARPAVLNFYGPSSLQYAYFYWVTDVVLAVGAFLLICNFFHRACSHQQTMWSFLRLMLIFVFIVAVGVTVLSLSKNYTQLFTFFIVEFSQNLYFSCLILNTLLYILMQQIESVDEPLGLLVCGMGIQFAGEAACFALLHLTSGEHFARIITTFLAPACTMGMLLVWIYAVVKVPGHTLGVSVPPRSATLIEAPVQVKA
jgi:hypothetical protein